MLFRSGNLKADAGESYVIFGGDFLGAVTYAGTSGDDSFSGSAADEVFVGGQGNDTLDGGGGADAFQGGAGDDAIIVGAGLPRDVDGGSGIDSVNLDALAAVIDLSGLDAARFHDIEKIDLTGPAANTLVLDTQSVLDMAGTNGDGFDDNTLWIMGNASDTVDLDLAGGWAAQVSGGTNGDGTSTFDGQDYQHYEDGAATLLIDTDIVVV